MAKPSTTFLQTYRTALRLPSCTPRRRSINRTIPSTMFGRSRHRHGRKPLDLITFYRQEIAATSFEAVMEEHYRQVERSCANSLTAARPLVDVSNQHEDHMRMNDRQRIPSYSTLDSLTQDVYCPAHRGSRAPRSAAFESHSPILSPFNCDREVVQRIPPPFSRPTQPRKALQIATSPGA